MSVYAKRLAGSLNDMRKEDQLCDVVITVSGRDFSAHRNVLAARSNYFRVMFTSDFREAAEKKVTINGRAEMFELILDYVYTGKLPVSVETAIELLEMACYMQLIDASQYIANFIQGEYDLSSNTKQTIPIGDVFKIHEIASRHDYLQVLARVSQRHMCYFFKELKTSNIFLQGASADFLKNFLKCPELSGNVEEKQVLELAVTWLKHDFENRRDFAPNLIRRVRLGLVPDQSLTELLDAEMLEIPECKKSLEELTKLQELGLSKEELAKKHPLLFSTRPMTVPIAFCTPVGDITWNGYFQYFDIRKKKWIPMDSMYVMSSKSWIPNLIVADGKLYAIGGEEVKVYSTEGSNRDWSDLSDEYRHVWKVRAKRYDAELNRWRSLPHMNLNRFKSLLVCVNSCIYVIGGAEGYTNKDQQVECYEVDQKQWKEISPLPQVFKGSSAISYHSSLLVYGQNYSEEKRRELFVYNASNDTWESKFLEETDKTLRKSRAVLFFHKDQCYRIAFRQVEIKDELQDHDVMMSYYEYSSKRPKEDVPLKKAVVNLLEIQTSEVDTVSSVSLGREIEQEFIPANKLGAFRIGEDVFTTVNAVVHPTDLKIKEDQNTYVDFGKWKRFQLSPKYCSNIVTFTCDWN